MLSRPIIHVRKTNNTRKNVITTIYFTYIYTYIHIHTYVHTHIKEKEKQTMGHAEGREF